MRSDGAELTMSGRAATNPAISSSNSDRVTFRAVSTERRYDEAAGEWVDGDEFGVAVVCWRQLGVSVLQLVRKGDPVVINGRMSTRRYEKDGATDYFTECKADHVAIDVGRAAGRVRRTDAGAVEPAAPAAGSGHEPAPTAAPDVPADTGDPWQAQEATGRALADVS